MENSTPLHMLDDVQFMEMMMNAERRPARPAPQATLAQRLRAGLQGVALNDDLRYVLETLERELRV